MFSKCYLRTFRIYLCFCVLYISIFVCEPNFNTLQPHLSKSMQVCKYAHSFSSSAPCNSCKCKKCIQHLMWMYLLRNRPIKIFTAGISLNSVLIYFKGFFKRREIEMSDNLEIMLLYHYLCLFLITHKYCQLLCHQGPNFCPVSQQ